MTMEPEITLRHATADDAPAITRAIIMAFGEDMTRRLCGDRGHEIIERLVRMDNTQYSYRNTIVCLADGAVAGAICGYDGAKLHELRQPVLDMLREECGTQISVTDETSAGEFYLDSVGVMPEMRGLGIGARLLERMRDEAFATGHDRVGLLVDDINPKAERLYQRLGFRRVGEVSFIGHTMHHMQCEKTK